jgi:hypothetical protein
MKKIELSKLSDCIQVKADGKEITNYFFSEKFPRPFLYPVLDPYGNCITRNFPMKEIEGETKDHPHHRSVWTAFGDVNGVDDWSELTGHGKIVHKDFLTLESGDFANIITLNHWVSAEGLKIMEEQREIKITNLDNDEKLLDFSITFKATESAVKFGDTKEGGIISVRMATPLDGDKGGIIENSSGGTGEKECWGKRAKWCDYSGKLYNNTVGAAIFDHPESFRFPTYWHVRDYGLFTVNEFGVSAFENDKNRKGDFTLEKNSQIKFKFRIYIHKGSAKDANLEKKYNEWINFNK